VVVSKDTFKPTKCEKVAGEGVYPFAENYYRVTKGKLDQQINDALMSLCFGDDELGSFSAPTQLPVQLLISMARPKNVSSLV
jgi:hypothetical protein